MTDLNTPLLSAPADVSSAAAPLALIVDDDAGLRMLAREALEACGLRIEEAPDGAAGLAAFQRLRPHIVLLDVMMPNMDGFETCLQLRRLARGANTPVLMMTGLDDSASIERAYESGATDFITKPITWPILGHRVRYMLRSAQLLKDLARSEASLANAHQLARLASWEWNAQTNLIRWSERAQVIFGMSHLPRDCTYAAFLESVHPDDRAMLTIWLQQGVRQPDPFETDFRLVSPDGTVRCVFAQAQASFDDAGNVVELHGALQDVTQRKAHENQIEYLATHDALTDLPNRNLFNDRARQAISHAERTEMGLGVLFIDLDHFKYVNDGYGHPVGDALLKVVAHELSSLMRQSDTVARLGGDEFVILLSDLKNAPFDASTAARKVLDRFARPMVVGDHQFTVTASIGISIYPTDGQDLEGLLMNADAAMYRAKDVGRNSAQFYAPEMSKKAIERVSLEGAMRQALRLGQFELHYQPQVSIATGKAIGMEALIRWNHPQMGMIPPVKFIPVAEEAGLIVPIGEWVLRTACAQNKAWQDAGLPALPVSVNLSAIQLKQAGFVAMVSNALEETGLDPRYLDLELTESMVMGKTDSVISRLEELKAIGIALSMDDFGTGYSNLGYLKSFPLDELKIDQSFVRDLPSNKDAGAIAGAIVSMGRSLGLRIVAEGVETAAQAAFLSGTDCEHAQGYLYSKPLPAAQFAEWLRANRDLTEQVSPLRLAHSA